MDRSRLRKHPIFWQTYDYDLLHVLVNKKIPLEELIGRELKWSSSTPSVDNILQTIPECENDHFSVHLDYQDFCESINPCGTDPTPDDYEEAACSLCAYWLRDLNVDRALRRYRMSSLVDARFHLRLGTTEQIPLRVESGIHAYPDEAEYPDRYPIVCVLKKRHDQYDQHALLDYDTRRLERFRLKRTNRLKSAEVAVVLLAMAQEQANCLEAKRFDGESALDPRLYTFKPFVILNDGSHVQFIRGRVSLAYLQALDQITKLEDIPEGPEFTISESEKLDSLRLEDLARIFSALDAIVSSYEDVEPLFSLRAPLSDELDDSNESVGYGTSNSDKSSKSERSSASEVEPVSVQLETTLSVGKSQQDDESV